MAEGMSEFDPNGEQMMWSPDHRSHIIANVCTALLCFGVSVES